MASPKQTRTVGSMSGKPRPLRFKIRSLLGLMALASVSLAVLTNYDIGAILGYGILLTSIAIMGVVVWDGLLDPTVSIERRQPSYRERLYRPPTAPSNSPNKGD